MNKILYMTIGLILCWSVAYAAPPTALKTDASATVERSVNTEFAVQNANNTAFYNQSPTKWVAGKDFTADNNLTVHDGYIFICTSSHTAASATEPGVGADWTTVWRLHGEDLTGAEIKTLYEAQADTNAFTDAEKTKLAGIEEGATVGGDGGSALEIEDESSSLDTAVTKINFLGDGISAVENADHEIDVTVSGGAAPIATVNGQTGTVVLDADDIDDTSTTNKFTTAAEKAVWEAKQDALINPIVSAGAQDVTGVKTFTVSPIVPAPTTDLQAATKKYVDDNSGTSDIPDGTTTGDALTWNDTTGEWETETPISGTEIGENIITATDAAAVQALLSLVPGTDIPALSCFADTDAFEACFASVVLGGTPAIADISDWPSTISATELGYLNNLDENIRAWMTEIEGDISGISVGSPLVSVPTYSDTTCTAGTYAIDHDNDRTYYCYATNTWDYFTTTFADWDSQTPSTYTLSGTITDTPATGSTFTIDGTAYDATDSPISISGLSSATQAITFTPNTDELGNCTGTGLTGTADTGPWAVDMSSADVDDLACTVSAAATEGFVGSAETTSTATEYPTASGKPTAYSVFTPSTSGAIGYCHLYSITYDGNSYSTNFAILSADGTTVLSDSTLESRVFGTGWQHFTMSAYTADTETDVMLAISRAGTTTMGSTTAGGMAFYRQATMAVADPFTTPVSGGTGRYAFPMMYCDNSPTGSL